MATLYLHPAQVGGYTYLAPLAAPAAAPAADTTAPTMAGQIALSAITTSGAHVAWSAGSDNVGVTGYEISVDTGTPAWVNAGTLLYYDAAGLAAGTSYTVRVRDYDAAGNRSAPITATLTTATPQANPPPPDPVQPAPDAGTTTFAQVRMAHMRLKPIAAVHLSA